MKKFHRNNTNIKLIIGIIVSVIGLIIVVSVMPPEFFLSIIGFIMIAIGLLLMK